MRACSESRVWQNHDDTDVVLSRILSATFAKIVVTRRDLSNLSWIQILSILLPYVLTFISSVIFKLSVLLSSSFFFLFTIEGSRTTRRAFEFGKTHVVRPKGKHQATIVWLHGLGDNGLRYECHHYYMSCKHHHNH